jgi:hypothetical protein
MNIFYLREQINLSAAQREQRKHNIIRFYFGILISTESKNQFYSALIYSLSFMVNCGLCGVQEVRVIVQMETTWANLIAGAAVPKATQRGSKLIFLKRLRLGGWHLHGSLVRAQQPAGGEVSLTRGYATLRSSRHNQK